MTATNQARLFAATIVSIVLYAAFGFVYGVVLLPIACELWSVRHG